MNFLLNPKGFTLTSVMVAAGLIGMLALGVATISKQMNSVSSNAQGNQDYGELKSEVTQYLSDENDCKASLSGISFKASKVNSEPVAVEVWSAKSNGSRGRLIVSGAVNSPKNHIGKIKVNSITLTLPDNTDGNDLKKGEAQTLKGKITLAAEKTVMGSQRRLKNLEKTVQITVDTDDEGTSVIRECQASADNGQLSCSGMGGEWDFEKEYCVLPGTPLGFCTPSLGSDTTSGGGVSATCPDIPSFTTRKIRGFTNGASDHVSCCYIPDSISSQGWCSPPLNGLLSDGGFEGCSAVHPLYNVVDVWGLVTGAAQVHFCCFLPKNALKTHPFCSSPTPSTDGFSGCGTLTGYKNVVITSEPTIQKTQNCCWYPE